MANTYIVVIKDQDVADGQIITATPGSCGCFGDEERSGSHRPWEPVSLVSSTEEPSDAINNEQFIHIT